MSVYSILVTMGTAMLRSNTLAQLYKLGNNVDFQRDYLTKKQEASVVAMNAQIFSPDDKM